MLALAARVLARGLDALGLELDRRRAIALELYRAAGAGGMIGGQTLDLAAEGRHLPMTELAEEHGRKTGALIAAACVIGGGPPAAGRGGGGGQRRARGGRAPALPSYDEPPHHPQRTRTLTPP